MWNSSSDFFAMGGYALYVWSSFGVSALVLLIEPLTVRARHQAVLKRLQRESLAEQLDLEVAK
ncbi:heme exporter protein D [Polynucleobacter sp. TUM22923]|jgi:heme exporter protein D|uniref:heme exporter protein CcmD n=1 Tax=Polynucleobacter sp. TUM22923 TaxID=3022126 RepID=UPI00257361FF|nr:heme exporter protein CcmD [Polynucleobacter sp. TUM22923]BDX22010.1 heme exporter protein D [Polynucleobacter sp. TUM22923]